MRFDNDFDVAGQPAEVIGLFADLPLMSSFLPGASVGERNEDGSYPATLVVAFGPKRIAFKGRLVNEADSGKLRGVVTGNASADMRGAKMSVTMSYQLSQAPPGTHVTLVSEAEMTGMLAEFARTGGVVVTNALLAEFASRFSAHVLAAQASPEFPADGPADEPAVVTAAAAAPPASPALSAGSLLVLMLKAAFRSLCRRLRR